MLGVMRCKKSECSLSDSGGSMMYGLGVEIAKPSGKPWSLYPRHSRHFLSGIYLHFVSDGSPLPTCGDDNRYAFG